MLVITGVAFKCATDERFFARHIRYLNLRLQALKVTPLLADSHQWLAEPSREHTRNNPFWDIP